MSRSNGAPPLPIPLNRSSRILIAPDSFKQSISARDAAMAMARGLRGIDPEIECDVCPIADGGEGTVDTLAAALGARFETRSVTGPLGDAVEARFALARDTSTGIVGLSEASGLSLVPGEQRDPTRTTTYGTGELIRAAMDQGCATIIVAIGGSATCDGGTGLAQALGTRFGDESGEEIRQPMCGGLLISVGRIEKSQCSARLRVACDVDNPLYGPKGAAYVYGPQKGATPQQVEQLDQGLMHLAGLCSTDADTPGSGAAGGAGYGLMEFCDAKLERGIDLILGEVDFEGRCCDADLVVTGEGRLDRQSLHGKATIGVAHVAHTLGKPVIAIVGSVEDEERLVDEVSRARFDAIISLTDLYGEEEAMRSPSLCIERALENYFRPSLD